MSRTRDPQHISGVIAFALTIFAGAFLIFGVQPMVAKHILPWFGGTPSVWLICLAFYQSALFIGYAYAYGLIAKVPNAIQPLIHAGLLALAWFVLPVLPAVSWKPDSVGAESGLIFAMLIANVALPFVFLASTGPLVQAWFARAFPGRSPYPLYAVSNLGSLLALVGYPFLLEPRLSLSEQSTMFSASFTAVGLAILGCAVWAALPLGGRQEAQSDISTPVSVDAVPAAAASGDESGTWIYWILLSAFAVVLFMGVTNQLCLDVASAPFLWVLPLSTYLITMILSFASERFYLRSLSMVFVVAGVAFFAAVDWGLGPDSLNVEHGESILVQVVLYSVMLFFGCMIAHGELYRLRPSPESLTRFYLCVSAGGALGGLFVGFVAPQIFNGYHELAAGVIGCWVTTLAVQRRWPAGIFLGDQRRLVWRIALVVSVVLAGSFTGSSGRSEPTIIALQRTFFGLLRVDEGGDMPTNRFTVLRHGTTRHGRQFHAPQMRRVPTTYFGQMSGIGIVLGVELSRQEPLNIGVIGLGVGTLAAYTRNGDRMVFYEIDPDVARIASDDRYFTYLNDSAADIEIVLGDARLSLERETHDNLHRNFDVLVIDAFSSDSIPVHLLTREALEVYQGQLGPDGLLAFHVSNRHLNLTPTVLRLGFDAGLHGMRIRNTNAPMFHTSESDWIVLGRSEARIASLTTIARARGANPNGEAYITAGRPIPELVEAVPLWTDDYSNIFGLLRSSMF
jgi:spermidine synthase